MKITLQIGKQKFSLKLSDKEKAGLAKEFNPATEFAGADEKGGAYYDSQDPEYRKAHWQWQVAKAIVDQPATLRRSGVETLNANATEIKKNGWYRYHATGKRGVIIPTLQARFSHACVIMCDANGKALDFCSTIMGLPTAYKSIHLPKSGTVYLEVTSNSTTGANNVQFT